MKKVLLTVALVVGVQAVLISNFYAENNKQSRDVIDHVASLEENNKESRDVIDHVASVEQNNKESRDVIDHV